MNSPYISQRKKSKYFELNENEEKSKFEIQVKKALLKGKLIALNTLEKVSHQ